MKNCNIIILTKKQQKYQHDHLKKFDKQEFVTGKEIFPFHQSTIIEQAKFTYSLQEKLLKNKQKQLKNKGKNQLKLQKF